VAAQARVREVYERAVACVPPVKEKRFWRRYVYLWINYALWMELEARDFPATRAVYRAALSVIPHETFTFAKLWLLAAHFEVRVIML
jgi:crooked neck